MAWAFVGVSSVVQVTATAHALTEPAGVQAGDLLVAVISSRIASTTSITLPAGWTLVAESKTNNVVAAATTSEASGMMAYIVRGDTAPALTFTHPTSPSVAVGRIVAYRGGDVWEPFDVGVGAKTGTAITAVSTTGLTTAGANELIVKGVCSGRASAFSAHDAATDPTTSSGTNSVQTAAPIVGTWQERQDATTTTGADTALAIADAIRGTAGATGALTCTASVSGGHAQVAGAFKIEPVETAGSSTITQTGSALDFAISSAANSGTVSSTITVPSDAQIVVVGLKGWCSTAPYFTSMTFTKGGADTAMTRVGVSELANGHTAAIFYLVLPDTGANKSLKFDWAGAAAPGESPLASVTFWKGIDTASPVRSSGGSLAAVTSSAFKTRTSLMTAQDGDLAVCFVGGDCLSGDGTVDTWYNLNLLTQCTKSADRHDGAWGTFAPSQNLYVGADTATGMTYGVCAAIVLAPTPVPTVAFDAVGPSASGTTANGTSLSWSHTASGTDRLVLVGVSVGVSPDTAHTLSVTYGGQAMTSQDRQGSNNGSQGFVELFSLVNPPTGAQTIVVTKASTAADILGGSISFTGVDQTTPLVTANENSAGGTANPISLTVASSVGNMVVCAACKGSALAAPTGSGMTGRILRNVNSSSAAGNLSMSTKAGAASNTLTYANSDSEWWGIIGVDIKAAPLSPLKAFAVNSATSGTTVTTTIPATAAGDCIIVAGLTQGPYQPGITITAGGQSVAFGKLGGLASPRYSPVGGHYDYVGIIINPTAGTTSVVLAGGTSGGHELACWVVSGLTDPVQDVGIWVPYQIDTVNVSGLSGTLAVADEFAVSFNRAANNTASINTSQSGSSGFTASAVDTANFNSGYSYQFTTATTPIQAAWNVDSGGGDTLLATYRSTPPAAPTPPPISLVGFAGRQLFDTTMNLDFPGFPATQAGDCIIFAGWVDGSVAGIDIRTPTNELGVFGTLGGVTSPVLSGSVYNFVGLIASPAVGTTSIGITTTASNSKGLAAWVVRGLTAPVTQDKGVWNALEAEPVSVSGLTGTLADANEFAVSVARPPNQVYSANVEQTGSGGFLLDTLYAWFDGGVSHQITESTASIQAAWNSGTGGADVTLATYKGAAAGVTGTLAETEDADVAAINATVRWVAALAAPETVDVLASVGTVRWQATLAETEDPDVAALNATVRWNAPLATTEAPDVGAFVGNVARIAILATREGDDVTLINGTVKDPIDVALATTEPTDVGAFTGTVRWQADLAATEAADLVAFLGTARWAATLATTEDPDTAALTASVRWAATLAVIETPDVGAFTGGVSWQVTLAAPEAADGAAFTGIVRDPISVTLGTTEAADVGAFIGNVYVPAEATLATTEAPDTAAFTGGVQVAGTLGTTEAPDVAALVGTTGWVATLATTEAADTAALLGSTRWAAALATTEAPDASALVGIVSRVATLATTEAPDTAALVGTAGWAATLTATEAADALAFLGGIYAAGPLAVTEAPDTAAMQGGIYATGTLITTEAPDVAAFLGTAFGAGIGVNLGAIEPADTAAFTGQVLGVAGVLAATETPDAAAIIGTTRWVATLATTEAADQVAFLGTPTWVVTLATTEAKDVAAMVGTTRWSAALATTEAPDQAAFTVVAGALAASMTLATVEAPDGAAFTGSTLSVGTLAASEDADRANIVGIFISSGVLEASEAPDIVLFDEAPVDITTAKGRILASGMLRVRELESHRQRIRVLKYPVPRPRELLNRYRGDIPQGV